MSDNLDKNIPPGCRLHCAEKTQKQCLDKQCGVYARWYRQEWNRITEELKRYDLSMVEIVSSIR